MVGWAQAQDKHTGGVVWMTGLGVAERGLGYGSSRRDESWVTEVDSPRGDGR